MKTDWLKRQRDCLKAMVACCWMLLGWAGCTDGFDTLAPQGKMTLRLVATSLDELPPTRAVNDDVKEDELNHLWVLQFDGTDDASSLVGKTEYSKQAGNLNPDDQILSELQPGSGQRLVFVANAPDAVQSMQPKTSTYADFKKLSVSVTDEETLFDDTRTIPMLGNWTGEIKSSTDGSSPITATIQMERIVSKIILKIQTMIPDGEVFALSSVRLHNVPGKMYLSKPVEDVFPVASEVTHKDYGQARRSATLPMTATWYMPENCRGIGNATVSTDKNAASLNAKVPGSGDVATWVEIIGDYSVGNSTYTATYFSYLGGNSTDDYNLRRNSAYEVTITIRGRNTSDSRVKLYGDAYTMVVNPDDADNSPNSLPVLGAVRNIRQVGKNSAAATSTLSVDGKAAGIGFVYSETVNTETALVRGNTNVKEIFDAPGSAGHSPGEYTKVLSELENGKTYYVRAVATNNDGSETSYGPITSFKTLEVQTPANCFMVKPGASVMFETKDAAGDSREVDKVELAWQTRDDGTESGNLCIASADGLIYDAVNKVVIVHTNPEARAGNAVFYGKKGDGDASSIAWCWHVWVTPYNPGNPTISGANKYMEVEQGRVMTLGSNYISTQGSKAMMDRDLGSQSTTTLMDAMQLQNGGGYLFGTYYHGYNVIPFPGPSVASTTESMPVFDINGSKTTVRADDELTGPDKQQVGLFMQGAGNPCPAGWHVPSDYDGYLKDLNAYGVKKLIEGNNHYKGISYIQGGVNACFLAGGIWNEVGTKGYQLGYQTDATDDGNVLALSWDMGTMTFESGSQPKSKYMNIRCVQK
ncbi:DUF4906 domain-containing protein [Parabacteroides segnis]|uniref:DUF4906 domain-containing protein n=1 Tax=Parabacteroides segnis TaxID=2763058 RepID=UPI0035193944